MENRQIKFRAWSYFAKKMYAVTNLSFNDNEILITVHDEEITNKIENGFCKSEDHNYVLLPDSILMQFTGLKDKNGIEIYEGDIVNVSWINKKYSVHFDGGEWCLFHLSKSVADSLFSWESKDLEVIGNIYENPELIEVQDGK